MGENQYRKHSFKRLSRCKDRKVWRFSQRNFQLFYNQAQKSPAYRCAGLLFEWLLSVLLLLAVGGVYLDEGGDDEGDEAAAHDPPEEVEVA